MPITSTAANTTSLVHAAIDVHEPGSKTSTPKRCAPA